MSKLLLTAGLFTVAAVVALLSFSASSVSAQLSAAKSLLAEREDSLNNLVKSAENLELGRCSRLSSFATSGVKNVAACGSTFPSGEGFKVFKNYGNDHDTCGSNCDGLIRSVNRSTALFAPESDFNNKDIQGFLANGAEMDKTLERERDRLKAWSILGMQSGAARQFPGAPRKRGSTCSSYDPRLRPWYTVASAGPKDVILVLDVSGSMSSIDTGSTKSRVELMKDAASALLGTFTQNDYFSIVTFAGSGSGRVILSPTTELIQGTYANINSAKQSVSRIIASGGTNFQTGFSKAYDLFTGSTEKTSTCKRVILFLTDGVAEDTATIDSYIQTKQTALGANNATIFTFSMGPNADQTRPRSIACANRGIASHIKGGTNPLNQMSSYFKLLALSINTTKPRWTEVYTDAFGMGRMTTVARPVYDKSTGSAIFVGVVEIDVPLVELTKFVTETTVRTTLIDRSKECPVYSETDCQLQVLRSDAGYECPNMITAATCRSSNKIDEVVSCSTGVTGGVNAMLVDGLNSNTMVSSSNKDYEDVVCPDDCGLSGGAIAGIVIGSIAGVALIGAGVYFIFFAGSSSAAAGGAAAGGGGAAASGASAGGGGYPSYGGGQPQPAPQPGYGQQPQPGYGQQGNYGGGQPGGGYPPQPAPQYGGGAPQYGGGYGGGPAAPTYGGPQA